MALQIEGRTGACDAGPLGSVTDFVQARHVFERHFDAQVDALGLAGIDDGDVAIDAARRRPIRIRRGSRRSGAAARSFLVRGRGRRRRPESARLLRAAAAWRRVRCAAACVRTGLPAAPARAPDATPRLVGTSAWISSSDYGLDRAQHLARVRRQQQVDRFRRGDQDVGGAAGEARALERAECRRCGSRSSARGRRCPRARAACAMPTSGERSCARRRRPAL